MLLTKREFIEKHNVEDAHILFTFDHNNKAIFNAGNDGLIIEREKAMEIITAMNMAFFSFITNGNINIIIE